MGKENCTLLKSLFLLAAMTHRLHAGGKVAYFIFYMRRTYIARHRCDDNLLAFFEHTTRIVLQAPSSGLDGVAPMT